MELALKIADATAKGQNITKTWDEATIRQEIDNLTDEDIDQVVNILFSSGIPTGVGFYESLDSLPYYVGFGPSANNFLTRIWKSVYKQVSPESQPGRSSLQQRSGHPFALHIPQRPIHLGGWVRGLSLVRVRK